MNKFGNRSLSSFLLIIIHITWWVECIFAGVVTVLAIGLLFAKKDISFNAPVSFSPVIFRSLPATNAGTSPAHLNITKGLLYLPLECNWKMIAAILFVFLVFFSLLLLVTYQLKQIFASFRQNEPFVGSNALRVRNIGLIVLIYPLVRFLFDAAFDRYLLSHFSWPADLQLTYNFNFTALAAGLVLIVIAGIFRLGSTLESEQKLTI